MKLMVTAPNEVEIDTVVVNLPVRYDDEDIPFDFPLRVGDNWIAEINIDTGQIANWPTQDRESHLFMKVCDEGHYDLMCKGKRIFTRSCYVPHEVIPGEFGDYVDLKISPDGVITNWEVDRDDLEACIARESRWAAV